MKNEFSIRTMTSEDMSVCINISREVFGLHFHKPIAFKLNNSDHQYLVCKKKNTIVGFSILHKVSKLQMQKITTTNLKLTFDTYFLIDVIAVTKKEQKKGVGSLLLDKILKFTDSKYPLYSLAWELAGKINIEKLYNNFNITAEMNLGRIWIYGCNNLFHCPAFNGICRCEGSLFYLRNNKTPINC